MRNYLIMMNCVYNYKCECVFTILYIHVHIDMYKCLSLYLCFFLHSCLCFVCMSTVPIRPNLTGSKTPAKPRVYFGSLLFYPGFIVLIIIFNNYDTVLYNTWYMYINIGLVGINDKCYCFPNMQ